MEKDFVCHVCAKTFLYNGSLKRHLKKEHQINEVQNYDTRCQEANCNFTCLHIDMLRKHLETIHNIKQDVEELHFLNMEQFTNWKLCEERKTSSMWVKKNQVSVKNGMKTTKFYCNRSGKKRIRCLEERKRKIKSQGSCKLNQNCTSSIMVKEKNDQITVTYYKTHYKHEQNREHLILPINAKEMVANQIRESVDSAFKQINLIISKDIDNITRIYNRHIFEIRDINDAISVDLWVEDMKNNVDNCVILYKKQGEESQHNYIEFEDFLLGIMTRSQLELLKKFGNHGIVCMDTTHTTNPYKFKLVTLLVVDDLDEAFPVAFLFSNRQDYVVLKFFIGAIREKSDDIEAKIFLCDDNDDYYSAWSSLMSVADTKKFLCVWHIDRAWRDKIPLIKNRDLQERIYKTLCVLRQEPDVELFNEYFKSFNNLLQNTSDLRKFKCFFNANYQNTYSSWALSHCKEMPIDNNVYLESMHTILKFIYLKGIECKRLDKTISVLLKFMRDKQCERVIKLNEGKITNQISLINDNHTTATNSKDVVITIEKPDTTWTVQYLNEIHTICKNIVEKTHHQCQLTCEMCHTCIHLFSCTCIDYLIHATICKHIHSICIYLNEITSSIKINDCEEEIEIHDNNLEDDSIVNILEKKKNSIEKRLEKITLKLREETREDVIDKSDYLLSSLEELLYSNSELIVVKIEPSE